MNDIKLAAAAFKDVEKLYRLLNTYSGNVRQCEKHIEFIDRNFQKNVREPLRNGGQYEFDLLMTAVYFGGEEIFSSKNPEFSLSHALFCEGLKSLTLRGQLTAQELVDWMMTIRSILQAKDRDESDEKSEDLASVLWRKNSPNINIALYNQLMLADKGGRDLTRFNADEDTDAFEAQFIREALRSEEGGNVAYGTKSTALQTKVDGSWLVQDERWQIPGGEKLLSTLGALGQRDPKLMERLRFELADVAISDKARKIIRFAPEELGRLRKEVEHLDQTQIDFNSLVHYIHMLECAPPSEWTSLSFGTAGFSEVIKSVVDRFHPGLILFILKKIEKWSTRDRYKELYASIGGELQQCINRQENLMNIASAFFSKEKEALAKELLKFVDKKFVAFMVQHLLDEKLDSGIKSFLGALLERGYKLEEEFFTWPEDMQVATIAQICEISFPQKGEWISRAMRNRSARVRLAAVKYVGLAKIDPAQATTLFERLDSPSQRVWLESLLSSPMSNDWKSFVAGLIKNNRWSSWSEEASALFVRLTFKYMGKPAVEIFEPWVSARKFVFWPKFPVERETILRVALTQKEISNLNEVREWARKERAVLFQNAELKSLLSSKGNS